MSKPLEEQLAALRSARAAAKQQQPRPNRKQTPKKQSWQARQRRPGIDAARRAKLEADAIEAQRWHNGVDAVVRFFQTAGLDARRTHDGFIVVEDLAFDLPRPRAAPRRELNDWIDQVVQRCFVTRLRDSLHANVHTVDASLTVTSDRNGFSLGRNGESVASVFATHAACEGGQRVVGNFMHPGAHWERLREAISTTTQTQAEPVVGARSRLEGSPSSLAYLLHTALQEPVDDELAAHALDASRRLRTERALVFGHVVSLEFGTGRFEFHPLRRRKEHLEVPLRWEQGAAFEGALRLSTASGNALLPIRLDRSVPTDLVAVVWVSALLAYAELTCQSTTVPTSPATTSQTTQRRVPPASSRNPARAITTGTRLTWADLEPIGATESIVASYVAGHRRRLTVGQAASADAKQHAQAAGLALRPGETWVQPHARGLPAETVLRFRWRPEAAVSRALGIH